MLPADGLPVISDPVVAECRDSDTRQCSFAYSRAATPELLRVEVSGVKGHAGHMITMPIHVYTTTIASVSSVQRD